MGRPYALQPAFQPNYHEQKADYEAARDQRDISETMKTILFPLEVSRQQLAATSAQQNIDAQTLQMQEAQKKIQDQADADKGYSETANRLRTALPGADVDPSDSPLPATVKGSLQAILDHRNAAREDRTTVVRKALDQKLADLESSARINNGLVDDDDWNDPAKRQKAFLNEQLGPARRALGADFDAVPMHDGRTAKDWLSDPTNFSKRGMLLPPVADELVGNATTFLKDREAKIKAAAEAAQKQSDVDIQGKAQIKVYEQTRALDQDEREKLRKESHMMGVREAAQRQAKEEIAASEINKLKLGTPEGSKWIDDRADQLVQRWAAQDGGKPAAPAGPPTVKTQADYDALPAGADYVFDGKPKRKSK